MLIVHGATVPNLATFSLSGREGLWPAYDRAEILVQRGSEGLIGASCRMVIAIPQHGDFDAALCLYHESSQVALLHARAVLADG